MNPLTNRLLGIYPAIYRCNHCSSLIEVSKEDIKTMNKESITSEKIPGGLIYKATEIQIKELRYYEYFVCPKCTKNPITFSKISYDLPIGIRPPAIVYGTIYNIHGENVLNEYLKLFENERS